jgi:hypothetical protein
MTAREVILPRVMWMGLIFFGFFAMSTPAEAVMINKAKVINPPNAWGD